LVCVAVTKKKLPIFIPTDRCYVTPLLGAYIADTYWGRYKTICWAVVFTLLGHIILIISAVPGVIQHKSAIGAFSVAIIIIGLGMFPVLRSSQWLKAIS
jgi:dipeptide/tripeptide permease